MEGESKGGEFWIDVNHARHSGLELVQPRMNRLPVSEGCVRAASNNNNPPPPTNHHPPPLPAAHACLAARHVATSIRSYNQRRSTFRLAQPRGLRLPRGSSCKPSRGAKLSQAGRWENKWEGARGALSGGQSSGKLDGTRSLAR